MAAETMRRGSRLAWLNRWDRWLAAGVLAAIVGIVVASTVMAANVAADHANFHAMFALIGAIPAGILAARPMPARWRTIAIVGLEVLAVTQLVEGVGAWGFGPDGYSVVSGIKGLHDLGVSIAPIGLIGAVTCVAVAFAVRLRDQGRGMAAIAVGGGVAVGGLLVVKTMIGF